MDIHNQCSSPCPAAGLKFKKEKIIFSTGQHEGICKQRKRIINRRRAKQRTDQEQGTIKNGKKKKKRFVMVRTRREATAEQSHVLDGSCLGVDFDDAGRFQDGEFAESGGV